MKVLLERGADLNTHDKVCCVQIMYELQMCPWVLLNASLPTLQEVHYAHTILFVRVHSLAALIKFMWTFLLAPPDETMQHLSPILT